MESKEFEKQINEKAEAYDKQLDALKEEVKKLDKIEDLEAKEKEVLKEIDANDEHVKTVKYQLPDAVDFYNVKYSRNDIRKFIIEFLNRIEVNWQMTLGVYELINFWKSKDNDEISYYMYDSTLRMLGNMKYKGFDDCKNILIINNLFQPNHNNFIQDQMNAMWLANKHNIIIDRMQELNAMTKPLQINE